MKTKEIFFVILRTQKGGIVPLVGDDGELSIFTDMLDADCGGHSNPLGEAFGYEVFQMEVESK